MLSNLNEDPITVLYLLRNISRRYKLTESEKETDHFIKVTDNFLVTYCEIFTIQGFLGIGSNLIARQDAEKREVCMTVTTDTCK